MKRLALTLAALAIVLPAGLRSSGATFVAASTNPGASFRAASDFTTIAVTLADPGTPLHGTVALSATVTSTRGIASVRFQTSAGAEAWTDLCTDTSAPYACSADTSTVADGLRDVRALATDNGGYQRSATVASRRFDNTAPSITIDDPGAAVRDTVTLQSTVSDGAGTGIVSVRYQWRPASLGFWIDLPCTTTTAPYSCAGDTRWLPDGRYEARAIATDGIGLTTTSAVVGGRIDNTDPATAAITDPGAILSGSETLAGSATDSGSGIASLRFEYAPAGSSNWRTACTDTAAPYACSWSTSAVADGLYDLRSVATDAAGNTRSSSALTSRRVDNTAPTVSMTDPGTPLKGSVTLSASAADAGGMASVTFERRLEGTTSWTAICSRSASPYACAWTTSGVDDGRYELRATAGDAAGNAATSAVIAARQVDNPPKGADVQPANGGTAHKLDAGDTLTFSWSEDVAPSSILAGWNGTEKTVTLRVTKAGASDTLSVWDAADAARLNVTSPSQDLQLQANRTSNGAAFKATATLSGSQLVIAVVSLSTGRATTSAQTAAIVWTPSASVTDLTGNACSAAAVTQSGWTTAKGF